MTSKIDKTDAEWRAELTPEEYHVLREKGTERAFTGAYWDNHDEGTYRCVVCRTPLFDSGTKFESGSGWPSFYDVIESGRVATHEDSTFGMRRVVTSVTQAAAAMARTGMMNSFCMSVLVRIAIALQWHVDDAPGSQGSQMVCVLVSHVW